MVSPLFLTVGLVLATASTFVITEDKIDFTNFKVGDPVPLTDLYVNYNQSNAVQFCLNLTESNITGLDQPSQIQRSDLTDQITYSYDLLQLEGQYSQDGIAILLLPVFGNGDYHIDASDVAITVNSSNPTQDWFFYVNDVNATFQDYLGGGLMSVIGQIFEPSLGDAVFHFFEPQIQNILESMQKLELLK